jgi:hypothetical protein
MCGTGSSSGGGSHTRYSFPFVLNSLSHHCRRQSVGIYPWRMPVRIERKLSLVLVIANEHFRHRVVLTNTCERCVEQLSVSSCVVLTVRTSSSLRVTPRMSRQRSTTLRSLTPTSPVGTIGNTCYSLQPEGMREHLLFIATRRKSTPGVC